jgi:tetratricopeptide (TPR) repeat protein
VQWWWSKRIWIVAVALLCSGLLVAIGLISRRAPPVLEIPVPRDLEKLDPQLRAYVVEKVAWVREKPADVHRHATLGMVYAANSLWNEALVAFQNAVQLNSKEPLARLYIAVSEQELGNNNEAMELFRQITSQFPDFAPGFYRLGDTMLRSGRVDEAEPPFKRLVTMVPREWRGYAGLGEIKLRKGDFAEAAKFLEKSVQLDPNAKLAHHLLGLAYRGLGRLADARLEMSLGVNNKHYPMEDAWAATAAQHMKLLPDLFEIAREYEEAGNPAAAVTILEQARAYHPNDTGVMTHLAGAYHAAGQPQKARELLLEVIKRDDHNLPAFTTLAFCCVESGLNEESLAHADRAVTLDPGNTQAHRAKANALLAMERDQEALDALETALRCDPRNAGIEIEIGDIYLSNLNRPAEALLRYRRAVQADPTLVAAYVRIAQMHIEQSQFDEARTAISMIRKLSPTHPALALLEEQLHRDNRQ